MAQMPRGEPRSVPDVAGEQYDEMLRQERLKRQIAKVAAEGQSSLATDYSSPFNPRVDFDQPLRQQSARVVGGREVDPRCVYVPGGEPPAAPSELANRRQAIERAFFMADHPLAGAAYGLAALANAPQGIRDGALVAGGVVDTAMLGTAPLGASVRGRTTPPEVQAIPPTLQRPNIWYGELSSSGQATGVTATLTAPMLGSGTKAYWRRTPPGWQGDGDLYNEARAHLYGANLGGSGREARNLVTLTQNGANSPQMSSFEREAARRARAGEVVEYSATPIYTPGVSPP